MFDAAKGYVKGAWWLFVLGGLLSIAFGLVALFVPGITLKVLIYIFGMFIVVVSVIELIRSLSNISKDRLWWLSILLALVGIGVGVYLLRNPLTAAVTFVLLAGILVIARGLFDLVVASYADEGDDRALWIISGLLGILAGVVILVYPAASSLAFIWVLGLYAVIHGVLDVTYAIRLRAATTGFVNEVKKEVKKATKK